MAAKARHELAGLCDLTGQPDKAFVHLTAFNWLATQAYGITTERKGLYLGGITRCQTTFNSASPSARR